MPLLSKMFVKHTISAGDGQVLFAERCRRSATEMHTGSGNQIILVTAEGRGFLNINAKHAE